MVLQTLRNPNFPPEIENVWRGEWGSNHPQSFGWPLAGFRATLRHPYVSLWPPQCCEIWKRSLRFAGFKEELDLHRAPVTLLLPYKCSRSNIFLLFQHVFLGLTSSALPSNHLWEVSVWRFLMHYLQWLTHPKRNGNKGIRLTECT